jgi:hypothetical protein
MQVSPIALDSDLTYMQQAAETTTQAGIVRVCTSSSAEGGMVEVEDVVSMVDFIASTVDPQSSDYCSGQKSVSDNLGMFALGLDGTTDQEQIADSSQRPYDVGRYISRLPTHSLPFLSRQKNPRTPPSVNRRPSQKG